MVFSPNMVIHWRLSENAGVVPRSEVSPEARKMGDGDRVVEIGGMNHAAEHPSTESESAVVDAFADVLSKVRSPSGHWRWIHVLLVNAQVMRSSQVPPFISGIGLDSKADVIFLAGGRQWWKSGKSEL